RAAARGAQRKRLAGGRHRGIVPFSRGRPGAFPSVEEAETYPYTPQETAIVEYGRRRTIAGDPEQVRERLLALAREHGAEEIMVVTITHDFKARLRSYRLLALDFGLTGPRAGSPASQWYDARSNEAVMTESTVPAPSLDPADVAR